MALGAASELPSKSPWHSASTSTKTWSAGFSQQTSIPKPDREDRPGFPLSGTRKDSLWSLDLLRCESAILRTYWALVVMDQFTRRIVGFAVHRGVVDGVALCRMFNRAIHAQILPKYLSSDHDPLYRYHQWQANLRVLEIQEIKTVPYVPLSHPFVERLIGTIRREHLDQTLFWTGADLEEKLRAFQDYFNKHRVHSGLKGQLPDPEAPGAPLNFASYRWQKHCRGLYQTPIAA